MHQCIILKDLLNPKQELRKGFSGGISKGDRKKKSTCKRKETVTSVFFMGDLLAQIGMRRKRSKLTGS